MRKSAPLSHRLLLTSSDQPAAAPAAQSRARPRTPPPPADGLTAASGGVAGAVGVAGVGALDEQRRTGHSQAESGASADRRRGRQVLPGVAVAQVGQLRARLALNPRRGAGAGSLGRLRAPTICIGAGTPSSSLGTTSPERVSAREPSATETKGLRFRILPGDGSSAISHRRGQSGPFAVPQQAASLGRTAWRTPRWRNRRAAARRARAAMTRDPSGDGAACDDRGRVVKVGAHARLQGSGAQCLALDGDTVYVGCRGGGLERSADGGDWFDDVPLPEPGRVQRRGARGGRRGVCRNGGGPAVPQPRRRRDSEELMALQVIPSRPRCELSPPALDLARALDRAEPARPRGGSWSASSWAG